ncbi:PIN-like domain-containing protein [Clostridium sp.]|uniref:PIN-like domain-containing protein n=1 Tax=Clostridium sp. TaxID=1506 RepID=UPI0032165F91
MTREKFESIWTNGYIILDTCTLDYISRCEFEYAKTIMDILLFCEDRVYLPQHVHNEMKPFFEKNKVHTYVDGHIKTLEEKIKTVYKQDINDKKKKSKIIGFVQKTINTLRNYSFGLYVGELEKLSKQYSIQSGVQFPDLSGCILKAEKEIDTINQNATVKRFLQMIMKNTFVGLSDDEKGFLEVEYKERLLRGLPPGNGDSGKGENSKGDLIIWKEILRIVKSLEKKSFLFITEDKKRNGNWYDKDGLNIHPALRQEVIEKVKYDAVSIMDLYHYIQACKPFVNIDIDKICEYLIEHNDIIFDEIERYFNNTGQELLMEEISEVIRSQHDGDWAIPYCYDISIEDLEYEVDSINETINVTFNFQIEGNAEACYHYDREDNMFDAEINVNGVASAEIPVKSGIYTNNLTLDFENVNISVNDEISVDTTDPLGRDEDFEEYCDNDELDEESWEYFDEDKR